MSNTTPKAFDAVQAVRTIRDAISARISTMSFSEENHWLRSTEFSDPRIRRLMDLAAQQSAAADGAPRCG